MSFTWKTRRPNPAWRCSCKASFNTFLSKDCVEPQVCGLGKWNQERGSWVSIASARQMWSRALSGSAPQFHDRAAKGRRLLALLYLFHAAQLASPAALGTLSIVSFPQETFFFFFYILLLPGCARVMTQSEKIVLLGYMQECALFTQNKGWCSLGFERKWLAMLTENFY